MSTTVKSALLWLAAFRAVLGVVAIPLVPFLYKEHLLILVVLRPTKDVLLAATLFALNRGQESLILQMVIAAVPLSILGVWHFYFLGKAWSSEIRSGKIGKLAGRILSPQRVGAMQKVLEKKGPRLVLLGRLAAFPSTIVAAAAGSSEMRVRKFLTADGLGGLASIVEVMAAAWVLHVLGNEFEREVRIIVKVIGVALFLGGASLFGRYLKRET